MRRAAVLLSASIAAGILIAGCGSSGDNQLSKAVFIEQGNAICKKGNDEIVAAGIGVFRGIRKATEQETTAFVKQTVVPNVQSQIDQLRDLSPPKDDEAQVTAILDEAQADVNKAKADPQLLVDEKSDAFKKANQHAKDYGLTVCAMGSY